MTSESFIQLNETQTLDEDMFCQLDCNMKALEAHSNHSVSIDIDNEQNCGVRCIPKEKLCNGQVDMINSINIIGNATFFGRNLLSFKFQKFTAMHLFLIL